MVAKGGFRRRGEKNSGIQLPRGENGESGTSGRRDLPARGVNRSGIKGRIKKGVARCK